MPDEKEVVKPETILPRNRPVEKPLEGILDEAKPAVEAPAVTAPEAPATPVTPPAPSAPVVAPKPAPVKPAKAATPPAPVKPAETPAAAPVVPVAPKKYRFVKDSNLTQPLVFADKSEFTFPLIPRNDIPGGFWHNSVFTTTDETLANNLREAAKNPVNQIREIPVK